MRAVVAAAHYILFFCRNPGYYFYCIASSCGDDAMSFRGSVYSVPGVETDASYLKEELTGYSLPGLGNSWSPRLAVRHLSTDSDGYEVKVCSSHVRERTSPNVWRPSKADVDVECTPRVDAALFVVSNGEEYPISQQIWCDLYADWFLGGIYFVGGNKDGLTMQDQVGDEHFLFTNEGKVYYTDNVNRVHLIDYSKVSSLDDSKRDKVNMFYKAIAAAMRMGNVDDSAGVMVVHDDVLLVPWHLHAFDKDKIWYPLDPTETMHHTQMQAKPRTNRNNVYSAQAHEMNGGGMSRMISNEPRMRDALRGALSCSDCVAKQTFSDVFYLPRRLFSDFIRLSATFGKYDIFCETAIPNIVAILSAAHQPSSVEILHGKVADKKGRVSRTVKIGSLMSDPGFSASGVVYSHPLKVGDARTAQAVCARAALVKFHQESPCQSSFLSPQLQRQVFDAAANVTKKASILGEADPCAYNSDIMFRAFLRPMHYLSSAAVKFSPYARTAPSTVVLIATLILFISLFVCIKRVRRKGLLPYKKG